MRGSGWIRSVLCGVAMAASTSCGSTGPGDEPWDGRADALLFLRVGQEVRSPDAVMRIGFGGVRGDSRCPVDVMCFWEGDAEVEIGVAFGMGPTVPYVLHTALEPRGVELGMYRITLVEVRPAPVSTSRIPPEQYIAGLRLERIAVPKN